MLSSVRPFIEPETSISSSTLRGRGAPLQPSEPQHLAVVAHALAQGAAQIGPRAAAGAHAAMAAPPRQAGRGLARQSAQRVAGRACREAAFDQRLGARGGQPGFVGFVGQQRFVLAASFLLQANHLLVFRASHGRSLRCRGNGGRTAGRRSRAAPAAGRASPVPPAGCLPGCAVRAARSRRGMPLSAPARRQSR